MSKTTSTIRQHQVINALRRKPSSFKEMEWVLDQYSEFTETDLRISHRTFQRDLNEIRTIYGIDIQFRKILNAYEIVDDDKIGHKERLFDAFETIHLLDLTTHMEDCVHFESRQTTGMDFLPYLLHAIKRQKQIVIQYQKYWEEQASTRRVEPYALKEYKQRWYLVARDLNDQTIKSFGIDRLVNITITKKTCKAKGDFSVEAHFKHCFGVINPADLKPEKVVLSFTPWQGKYMQSLPLHHSQKELVSNEKEFRIQLLLYLTHDFLMEILSFGENVVVAEPVSFARDVQNALTKGAKGYAK